MDPKALKTGELKKHIGAIYVAGDLTLLQRKIANILRVVAPERRIRAASFMAHW